MQQAFYLTVTGQVQGVGYRLWFAKQAQAKDLRGYVKNLSNGDVEAVIIGERSAVQEMLDQSLLGPQASKVTYLNYQSYDQTNYTDFQILR
jgi:acylphosphatase